jgi:uncharacterized protein
MSQKQERLQIVSGKGSSAGRHADSARRGRSQPRVVSGRWLISALIFTIGTAALCAWGTLCLLFWQGSWQLLYHPSARVARTPASAGLAFDSIAFAVNDAGVPRLSGWWIPAAADAPYRRFTVVYLHDEKGNLGDTVDSLAELHAIGVNVFAFDYRGYGQSQFARPSEAHWRQDADWALQYLIGTRHLNPGAIVLDGEGLGANLALEAAAAHPELAGVVLNSPIAAPTNAIFNDGRARLVPAHLLVHDRYDLNKAAAFLRIPSLWFEWNSPDAHTDFEEEPEAFRKIAGHKTIVWLNRQSNAGRDFTRAISRWFDELPPQHVKTRLAGDSDLPSR